MGCVDGEERRHVGEEQEGERRSGCPRHRERKCPSVTLLSAKTPAHPGFLVMAVGIGSHTIPRWAGSSSWRYEKKDESGTSVDRKMCTLLCLQLEPTEGKAVTDRGCCRFSVFSAKSTSVPASLASKAKPALLRPRGEARGENREGVKVLQTQEGRHTHCT